MKSMSNVMKVLFSVVIAVSSVNVVSAQSASKGEIPKVEAFIGYSAIGSFRENEEIKFGPNSSIRGGYATEAGFETSLVRNFTRYIGIKGDFSAHFKNDTGRSDVTVCIPTCTPATQDFQFKTRVYNFLAGPEFKARNSTRFTPVGHVLGGVAHTSANFSFPGPNLNFSLARSDTSFAMAVGGGLDIRITSRVSFRAQFDYNPIFQSSSAGGRRDMGRISFGVLFH